MSVREHVKIARDAGGPVAFLAVLCMMVGTVFIGPDATAGIVFLAAGMSAVAAFFIIAEITASGDEMRYARIDGQVDRRAQRR